MIADIPVTSDSILHLAPAGRHVYGICRGPVPYRYLPNGYGTAERAYYLKQKKQG